MAIFFFMLKAKKLSYVDRISYNVKVSFIFNNLNQTMHTYINFITLDYLFRFANKITAYEYCKIFNQ